MPGKNYSLSGHPSRSGLEVAGPSAEEQHKLWITIWKTIDGSAKVDVEGFHWLVKSILNAKIENSHSDNRVVRPDVLRQLRYMKDCDDTKLIDALRKCDSETLHAVNQQIVNEISDGINTNGFFTDIEGWELRYPRGMMLCGEEIAYFPTGLRGARKSVVMALDCLDDPATHGKAGNRAKPHQIKLALACRQFFASCHPPQEISVSIRDGVASSGLPFAREVFHLAGDMVGDYRLVNIFR